MFDHLKLRFLQYKFTFILKLHLITLAILNDAIDQLQMNMSAYDMIERILEQMAAVLSEDRVSAHSGVYAGILKSSFHCIQVTVILDYLTVLLEYLDLIVIQTYAISVAIM